MISHKTATGPLRGSCVLLLLLILLRNGLWAEEKRPFTVRDDIALTQFGDVWLGNGEQPIRSPKGDFFAVRTTRGDLSDDRIHDRVLVFRMSVVEHALTAPEGSRRHDIHPEWSFDLDAPPNDAGTPAIEDMQWLADGSGLILQHWTDRKTRQLTFADLATHQFTSLSDEHLDVLSFAVHDVTHYVFTTISQAYLDRQYADLLAPQRIGTGKSFALAQFPNETLRCCGPAEVWAATGGSPHRVVEPTTGEALTLFPDGVATLALSNDGLSLVTIRAVSAIPKDWEVRYGPPFPGAPYRLVAGRQDLNTSTGAFFVGEYVLVHLDSGMIMSLTGAPEARRAGWLEGGRGLPAWSSHDDAIVLPGTFLASQTAHDRPCVALVTLASNEAECIASMHKNLARGNEDGYARIRRVSFEGDRTDIIAIEDARRGGEGARNTRYTRAAGGWQRTENLVASGPITIQVVASPRQRPLLMATDHRNERSLEIYDPNPQLDAIALALPQTYTWTDSDGVSWRGLLYLPARAKHDQRVPLVIQNHGIEENRFVPSGEFPSAFIAQELASSGIAVLQVSDCPGRGTPAEGICNVHGYEAAIHQLAGQGKIDPERVGVIGFSRTVFYVLEALTQSPMTFRAASITDGINMGYAEYLTLAGSGTRYDEEERAMIGSLPLGKGMDTWIAHSPVFNLAKVACPVRVVGKNAFGVIGMWEPYSLLKAQQKPVDFIILNTREHVINAPVVRLTAQEGNLDWFRFWLQGYEDPNPAKKEQYERWHALSKP